MHFFPGDCYLQTRLKFWDRKQLVCVGGGTSSSMTVVSQTLWLLIQPGSHQNAGQFGWVRIWGSRLTLRNCRFLHFPVLLKGEALKAEWQLVSSWWDRELSSALRTKQQFNCRLGSRDGSQIIKYIIWVETREKFRDDLFEAILSQSFIPRGPEANEGLQRDCHADGKTKWVGCWHSSLTSCYCTQQRRSLPLQYCSIVLGISLSLLRPSWFSFFKE